MLLEDLPARLTPPRGHARNRVVAELGERAKVTGAGPRAEGGEASRRVVSVLLAVACAGGAWLWSARELASHRAAAAVEAHRGAEEALTRALDAVGQLPAAALTRAAGAATLDSLNRALAAGVNDASYRDLLRNESAFQPYRQAGAVAWVVIAETAAAATEDAPGGTEDLRPTDAAMAVAAAAAGSGRASGWLTAPALAVAGAARLTSQTPNGLPAVLLYAQRLDAAALGAATAKLDDSVALVPRGAAPLVAGRAAAELKAFLDQPAAGAACCALRELSPGLSVAVLHDPTAVLTQGERDGARTRLFLFAAAALLGLGALAFGFWPRGEAKLLQETAAELQRSREELQRLSQVLTTSGSHPLGPGPAQPADVGLLHTQQTPAASRYQVVDLLGEGGMAQVYVAFARGAEGFKRTFVLKRLRSELLGNTDAVNQFIDEGKLGASLVHSNIVPVFDFGRDAEGYYLAQEYILGRNLEALVERSVERTTRPLEPAVVLFVAQQALAALGYAHARADEQGKPLGLVHRDVSPNNLMVSALGELKLLDFGIVKGEHRLTKTQAGMVKGNLFYMSPEQARGAEVDGRSDLYSLGLVLFYAGTGQTLFNGNTPYELLVRTAAGVTAQDLERIRRLPAPLGPLIERALATDLPTRYASADEFAKAVAAAGTPAAATEVRALMETLFREDFETERARFAGPPT